MYFWAQIFRLTAVKISHAASTLCVDHNERASNMCMATEWENMKDMFDLHLLIMQC